MTLYFLFWIIVSKGLISFPCVTLLGFYYVHMDNYFDALDLVAITGYKITNSIFFIAGFVSI